MVVYTIFDLQSLKEQLVLLANLTSHINAEEINEYELSGDCKRLLEKVNNSTKNINQRYEEIKKLLGN